MSYVKVQIVCDIQLPRGDCYGCDLCYDCLYCMANHKIQASNKIPKECPILNGYILKK